jgi:hypothetical protein
MLDSCSSSPEWALRLLLCTPTCGAARVTSEEYPLNMKPKSRVEVQNMLNFRCESFTSRLLINYAHSLLSGVNLYPLLYGLPPSNGPNSVGFIVYLVTQPASKTLCLQPKKMV